MSTICAVSTPLASGALSVIRMSGEQSLEIAANIFVPFGKKSIPEMPGHTCAYGRICDGGRVLDDVLVTVFRAPASYTGEDTVEISCHGGIYITNQILRLCIAKGAQPAQAGEFTKRAMLNGKLDLTQAEAVMEMITAQGEQALSSAVQMRGGALAKKIHAVQDGLTQMLSGLAAWVDFPEEDLPEAEPERLAEQISILNKQLREILADYDGGRYYREGVATAIVGRPNVGKSTLMNLLLGYERSIVTDIAGTTRDVIEESAKIGGVVLRLADTAGLRDTTDTVEKIGVSKARAQLAESELVLAVFDTAESLTEEDFALLSEIQGKKSIGILNKSDLPRMLSLADENQICNTCTEVVEISAKNELGKKELDHAVVRVLDLQRYDGAAVFVNERQKACLEKALGYFQDAKAALDFGQTLDAVTVTLEGALQSLLELTGDVVSDKVVAGVFAKFCVGK